MLAEQLADITGTVSSVSRFISVSISIRVPISIPVSICSTERCQRQSSRLTLAEMGGFQKQGAPQKTPISVILTMGTTKKAPLILGEPHMKCLQHALSCPLYPWPIVLVHIRPCHDIEEHGFHTLYHTVVFYDYQIMLCSAMLCYVMLCYVMIFCYVILLSYVVICYVMLCYTYSYSYNHNYNHSCL